MVLFMCTLLMHCCFTATSVFNTSHAKRRSCLPFFSVLKDLKYADTHEWVKVEGDSATVGITDHAQVDTFIHSITANKFRC